MASNSNTYGDHPSYTANTHGLLALLLLPHIILLSISMGKVDSVGNT